MYFVKDVLSHLSQATPLISPSSPALAGREWSRGERLRSIYSLAYACPHDHPTYAFNISLCRSALSKLGLIFISRNSLMAKSRCSRASFFSAG